MARRKKSNAKEELMRFGELPPSLQETLGRYVRKDWEPAGHRSSDNCPVCGHILRTQIEELIYAQVPPPTINRYLEALGHPSIIDTCIKKHAKEHCALTAVVNQLALERYRNEVVRRVDGHVTGSDLLQGIMDLFAEQPPGFIKPGDAIRAAKVKNDIEGGTSTAELFERLFRNIDKKKAGEIEGEVESEE